MVGGEQIIVKTQELRKSIEGLPPQAEGITKTKANFRLDPGRRHKVIEVLPPGKKFEVYQRVVTLREDRVPSGQRERCKMMVLRMSRRMSGIRSRWKTAGSVTSTLTT